MDIASIPPSQLAQIPALLPPPGVVPNFEIPSADGSNARETIIATAFLTALTVVFLVLRVYTKLFVVRNLGWEDYLSIGGTIGIITYNALIIYVFKHGFGVHQWNVHLDTLIDNTSYLNGMQYLYAPTALMAKTSICLFFYKIWRKDQKMRLAIVFVVAWILLQNTAFFFLNIFLCIPGSAKYWQCTGRVSVLNVIGSSINVACDVYLLVLPLFGIARLQMHSKQKWGVSFVFLIGILAVLSSILGVVYRVRQDRSSDITWVFAPEIILVLFELQATTIAGCTMAMPSLFRKNSPKSLASLWSRSRIRLWTPTRHSSDSSMTEDTSVTNPSNNPPRKSGWDPKKQSTSYYNVTISAGASEES